METLKSIRPKQTICSIIILLLPLFSNPSFASPDIGLSMIELEQYDANIGDNQYQITKAHTVQGKIIHIDNSTVNPLLVKDQEGNKLADIYLWKNYVVECDQLLEPVVYNITDKNEYQLSLIISCGDSIRIKEAK